MTGCRIKRLRVSEIPEPSFSVFVDNEGEAEKQQKQKSATQRKPKLKMRKCLVEKSVEEALAEKLYPKELKVVE